ncbi:MAG: hypothetical protein KU37_08130 [Sulfuricurvum sp. PC08-66]|nr:MAG: hypothetical protein KU37_08130 [Sulfuricurvum sp. PC08-66]
MGGKTNLFEIGAQWGEGWSLEEEPKATAATHLAPNAHALTLQRQKRNGKVVTIIGTFAVEAGVLASTLKALKNTLACGGTIEGDTLLLQGEHATKAKAFLQAQGWRFKH